MPAIAFLFPGQGSQELGMGPAHNPYWHFADPLAEAYLGCPLSPLVFPSDTDPESAKQRLQQTQYAQPALLVASLGYATSLRAAGIAPNALLGHSLGEYTALVVAESLSFEEAFRAVCARGLAMAGASQTPTGMLSVRASATQLAPLLSEKPQLVIANHNSPRQLVLAGSDDDLQHAATWLRTQKIAALRLPVSHAFHSPYMQQAAQTLTPVVETLPLQAPQTPLYSSMTAAPCPTQASELRSLLSQQITAPVRFAESIQALYAAGVRLFVEVGPRSVLCGLVREVLQGRPHRTYAGSDPAWADHRALRIQLSQDTELLQETESQGNPC